MNTGKLWFFQPAHHTIFQGHPSYWFPYSVGCLWSYARQYSEIQDFFGIPEFVFKREPLDKLLPRVTDPNLAVFSNYTWNFRYNLAAAAAIKQQHPQCLIVFGGPQITNRPFESRFFKLYPYIDCIVNGEGEQAFVDICRSRLAGKPVPRQIKGERLTDLSYPSPYSGGVFDELVKQNPDYHWQVTLETNRGCPFQCTFCDWGSAINSKIHKFPLDRVMSDIDWCSHNKVDYVFMADANFGIFYERDREIAQKLNQVQLDRGFPKVVLAQWTKNSQARVLDIAKIFFNDRNRGFTLSVQSMNDAVLDAVKRKNMQISDMSEMLQLCQDHDISAYTELILGLPFETRDSWRENHWRLLEIGQHNNVDVWLLALLENSELNTVQQRELHGIEAVSVAKYVTGAVLDSNDVRDIPEQEWLVRATKYMNNHDLIDSYIFSALISHYHYISGATLLSSRVITKYNHITYKDFYEHLEHSIKSNAWLSQPYERLKAFLKEHLNGYDPKDKELTYNSHNAFWMVHKILLIDIDKMMHELKKIFTPDWCGMPRDLYDQLWDFQDNYIIRWNQQYPVKRQYDYDFLSYLEDGKLEQPVVNIFEWHHKPKSVEEFLEKAYYNRRTRHVVNAFVTTQIVN